MDLIEFFNQDLPELPSSCRRIAHAFVMMFIGSKLLQPYPDNCCVLRLLAMKILMDAGFDYKIVHHPRILDITVEDFFWSLC